MFYLSCAVSYGYPDWKPSCTWMIGCICVDLCQVYVSIWLLHAEITVWLRICEQCEEQPSMCTSSTQCSTWDSEPGHTGSCFSAALLRSFRTSYAIKHDTDGNLHYQLVCDLIKKLLAPLHIQTLYWFFCQLFQGTMFLSEYWMQSQPILVPLDIFSWKRSTCHEVILF